MSSNTNRLRCKPAFEKIRKGARPDVDELKGRYPECIPNLLRKCLLHNPSDRPSATELVEYLGVHIPKEKPRFSQQASLVLSSVRGLRSSLAGSPDSRSLSPVRDDLDANMGDSRQKGRSRVLRVWNRRMSL